MSERQTVSIMKACEMVGVSRRTIYNWIAANKVEYLRTAGGSIRIFVDTLWRNDDGTYIKQEHIFNLRGATGGSSGERAGQHPDPSSRRSEGV